jgi:hypothetical protein
VAALVPSRVDVVRVSPRPSHSVRDKGARRTLEARSQEPYPETGSALEWNNGDFHGRRLAFSRSDGQCGVKLIATATRNAMDQVSESSAILKEDDQFPIF